MTFKVNEIKISYREHKSVADSPQLTSSREVSQLLYANWDPDTLALKESFKILLLNNSNRVKGTYQVSDGGITGTVVDLRILFGVVLKTSSVGIILAQSPLGQPQTQPTGQTPDRKDPTGGRTVRCQSARPPDHCAQWGVLQLCR